MLNLNVEDFMVEFKDGSIKNVGAPNKRATAKLYDVVEAEAREFGDERVKLVFEDQAGSEVHVALDPAEARTIREDVEALEDDSRVFEEE